MRSIHKQWLAAMAAAALPGASDCYSSPSAASMGDTRPLHDMIAPKSDLYMLLSSKNSIPSTPLASDRFGGRSYPSEEEEVRALGFDTRLWVSSSLDADKWKAGNVLNVEGSSPIKNQVASSLFRRQHLAWFPWVPTLSQIKVLKVSELQQACAERGLQKSGLKAELQERLWEWTQRQDQKRVSGSGRSTPIEISQIYSTKPSNLKKKTPTPEPPSLKENSLAEWSAANVDHLLTRRQAIHRDKHRGKPKPRQQKETPPPPPQDYRKYLAKAFEKKSPSSSNNRQVKQMYAAAKLADQAGDRQAYRVLLEKLRGATPHDGRIIRRLSRMHVEDGNVDQGRAVLQEGLRQMPDNAFLWHGLGQLQVSPKEARKCFQKAIAADPSLPHPYHALGTMEHSQGRIAVAMKVLKKGLEYCPTNHRLHHALGDLFREAKMLEMAEKSYKKALEYGPRVSHPFAYTALAYVAYENGNVEDCRYWLRKGVSLNNGRHSQGWVDLAEMEESEGNIDAARAVCIGAISQYERGLWKRQGKLYRRKYGEWNATAAFSDNPLAMKETLFKSVPQYRSGDKFINVFRNWARLEEKHGNGESVDEVYTRASFAFPYDWKLLVNWAQYHARVHHMERARELFDKACKKAKNRHADPYRIHAEFEMSFGNHAEARKILFRGAQQMSESSDGGLGNRGGMAELFHTWAVCEWHLGNLSRAEALFDRALRLTDGGEDGSKLRSFIFYSIASLEFYRGEYELAQHCIALCLKENVMPGGNSKIWKLWADVATAVGNDELVRQCEEQAAIIKREEHDNGAEGLSRMLELSKPRSLGAGLSKMVGAASQPLMRRDPWHDKLFGSKNSASSGFFSGVELPSNRELHAKEEEPFVVCSDQTK